MRNNFRAWNLFNYNTVSSQISKSQQCVIIVVVRHVKPVLLAFSMRFRLPPDPGICILVLFHFRLDFFSTTLNEPVATTPTLEHADQCCDINDPATSAILPSCVDTRASSPTPLANLARLDIKSLSAAPALNPSSHG
jgi:hypothetical protein